MKLAAFRIRNYRAILDTGWVTLSPDNITTLIGQNESGKTSVLEALYSFYTGNVHEDVLRSDLSLPYISCSFNVDSLKLDSIINPELIKPLVYNKIVSSGSIFINRKWTDQNKSDIFFGDDQLILGYEEAKIRDEQAIGELEESVHLILEEVSRLAVEAEQYQKLIHNQEKNLTNFKKRDKKVQRILQRANGNKKEQAEAEHEKLSGEINSLEKEFAKILEAKNKVDLRMNELIRASKYAKLFLESGRKYKSVQDSSRLFTSNLQQKNLELRFCTDVKKSQILKNETKNLEQALKNVNEELDLIKESFEFNTDCLALALSEPENEDVEIRVTKTNQEKSRILSPEELGLLLFKQIPVFKLFEDFSSLLPNRIDLDDILSSNISVEGFNAVKNFLIVSGLDASFFSEQNNRILKQKIENLNGELTLHFQDYWRQNVGRNNKIKINFELEHYDYSHPSKKGKPYLEFWIKDEHERLYPKQRSRGVRWFLSFYLELKATSMSNKSGANVLLIDEPGLSLHTRAQEDVLKVFEDMKDNIQIIYSTHSPHLVDVSKLFRILAVQRADEYNDKSESLVFDVQKLGLASGDTLSPVYSLIGSRLSDSNFLQERSNIIVEDTYVFYYLKNLLKIFGKTDNTFFLPANGVSNIPVLVNLMLGWNLKYAIFLTNNHDSNLIYKELTEKHFKNEKELLQKKVLISNELAGIENVFSTIDFKKHVLQQRVGITESNLDYIENSNLSRKDLSTAFSLRCQEKNLSVNDFDEETRENVDKLINNILKLTAN